MTGEALRPPAGYSDAAVDRAFRAVARVDMELYARLQRYIDSLSPSGKPLDAIKKRARDRAISICLEGLHSEATEAEKMYLELRLRQRVKHADACKVSGMTMIPEPLLQLRRGFAAESKALREKLADEMGVTRQDVIQGFLNAVQCASNSKELTESWRELGRLLGYYEETKIRIEQNVKTEATHTIRLEGVDLRVLSDADLRQFAGAEMLKRLAPAEPRVLEHQPAEVLDGLPQEIRDVAEHFVRVDPPADTQAAGGAGTHLPGPARE